MLPLGLTAAALADAEAEQDPDSLAAATRLRRRHDPEIAALALDQAGLRRRATAKFGAGAGSLFFTRDGLEQATRPSVAAHHAHRLADAGATRVLDLGCGIGSDAMAFLRAGLDVVAVETDERTAEIAEANISAVAELVSAQGQVIIGDAEQLAEELIKDSDAVFIDPARRTGAGRLWRVEDFTPSWSFVTGLLDGSRPAGVKLGPALPHREIPDDVEAEWVTDHGETVEVCLWAGRGSAPGVRAGLIMPDRRLVADPRSPAVQPAGRYLYEPDGAVIRAGAIGALADELGGWLLDDQIAYLSSDLLTPTPYAVAFEISEILPYKEKVLRRWVRDHAVGRLEIKKRGIDVDPAQLRKRLRPAGADSATMIISRTPDGTVVFVARRAL
ncbi:THUMP-like domain-containing protein [Microlunatus soli]|uniref:Methyltransferase domain-containing protein n=1 Tax=Microlunatus soli TaxID=630515 RepID=A0A1H1WWQ9_9ACTN|nr:methyltransferase domain-containing protein [Microlunatus soli]SDT01452.1 Methyltransferase domain-containing protein [Microlunatus soli]